MSSDKALAELARQTGIVPKFRDLSNVEQLTSRETRLALLRASGWQLDNDAMIVEALKLSKAANRERLLPQEVVVLSRTPFELETKEPGTWHLALESRESRFEEGRASGAIQLPALCSGVHKLTFQRGSGTETVRVIAAPRAAPSIVDMTGRDRLWGINLALYGLHSRRNPGVGDYEDLKAASIAFAGQGADFCGINPVHAIGWNSTAVISPYSPSHRGFINTNYIALDQIEPASESTRALIAEWSARAEKRVDDEIDYQFHTRHHRLILSALYQDFKSLATQEQQAACRDFCDQSGTELESFARYETQSDHHGTDWRKWPVELQNSSNASQHEGQAIHMWLQWHAEMQLQAAHQHACSAGMNLGLYLDLAVGARRDGAEAWAEQESIAEGVSIGAPPDHLSPAGQNWNLSAFAPGKLATTHYRAFRNILARNMRHCGVLRIDHVLGLNRSFWIPDDGSPGGYIQHNFETLLALVRIEAERNQTVIIGEDLGLVPAGFRKALQGSGIYSYSVLQYEKTRSGSFRKPSRLRKNSLACFGTHDTPTLAGFAAARDVDWWQKLGWIDDKTGNDTRRQREQECDQLMALAPSRSDQNSPRVDAHLATISQSTHKALAASPVSMISVQLDDIEGKSEAQNLPVTIDEHPNWQRRSGTPIDDLPDHQGLAEIARLMLENGRGNRIVEQGEIQHAE